MSYNDQELNNLEYELVLKYDNRTFYEYYISLIKTKHLLIFSFCYNNDYNSKIIKLDLFFLTFIIYFAINALFFNDDTMHKILEEKGKYSIIYQLPQIIYSSLISSVLISLLKFLALSENDITTFKNNKTIDNLEQRHTDLKNKLFIKFISFFIIGLILLLFFCYYLSLLKTKHILIFTFCNNNDYNSKIIKIDLFLFNFAISYMVNALFFDDDTMHKIYKNKGAFDILDQLPPAIYSLLISSFFLFVITMIIIQK
jgi:hypothetical protein